jgi:uncharacterized protein
MSAPQLRRTDRVMSDARIEELLANGFCGRLATVGADGAPYCVPLLYVWLDGEVLLHNTGARGHLRTNVEHEARVCFEIDAPGQVFDYGRFECDSSVSYGSVIVHGRARIVTEIAEKQRFCEALMAKYRKDKAERPKGFFPRLGEITVYAITVDRMTGKELALPEVSQQWPAVDMTKSPRAQAPT